MGAAASVAMLPNGVRAKPAGRLKQGVTRQVFPKDLPLEDCCKLAASVGIRGFDFISDPREWSLLKRYDLTLSMLRPNYHGFVSTGRPLDGVPGWDAIGLQEAQGVYLDSINEAIETAAQHSFSNVLVLAGDRERVTYQAGSDHAVAFLNLVKARAEDKGITLCMELLNSHGFEAPPKSLFDHTAWGVEVMKRVDSPRVKILFDVFHAQLMDGNIVQNIRENIAHIGHFHVGSVPGRHELDNDDELDYRVIARTIADLNFKGFVTHEWTPSKSSDGVEDLKRSVDILTV
jgi:hydroxypyruvate isomerase